MQTIFLLSFYVLIPNFAFFTVKSPSVTQRSVSQENAYKKSLNTSPLFHKTIGSYNSFTLIENNFSLKDSEV